MSGIYIPDVGLPQDGDFELWIAVRKDCSFTYNVRGGWQDGTQKVVPVPLHGDLIDRDALIRDWPTGFVKTADVINNTPTIIPGDPAEEGENAD